MFGPRGSIALALPTACGPGLLRVSAWSAFGLIAVPDENSRPLKSLYASENPHSPLLLHSFFVTRSIEKPVKKIYALKFSML
jgi:hypothetical protein